jgi:hypothetical protein
MTRPGGFEKDAQLDQEGFRNVLKLRAEVAGQWGGHVPPPKGLLRRDILPGRPSEDDRGEVKATLDECLE